MQNKKKEKNMKKNVFSLILVAFAAILLVGCGKTSTTVTKTDTTAGASSETAVREHKGKDFYVVGDFNENKIVAANKMTSIKLDDARISSVYDSLKDVNALYIAEVTLAAGKLNFTVVRVDSGVTDVTKADDYSAESFVVTNHKTGVTSVKNFPKFFTNLTETTLTVTTDSYKAAAKAAGTYYVVFAESQERVLLKIALIEKK